VQLSMWQAAAQGTRTWCLPEATADQVDKVTKLAEMHSSSCRARQEVCNTNLGFSTLGTKTRIKGRSPDLTGKIIQRQSQRSCSQKMEQFLSKSRNGGGFCQRVGSQKMGNFKKEPKDTWIQPDFLFQVGIVESSALTCLFTDSGVNKSPGPLSFFFFVVLGLNSGS
jgi:hypothetical protein